MGTIELGRINGKRHRKYVRAKTKAAVLAKLSRARQTIAAGLPVADETRTLAAYLGWWGEHVLPGTRVKPTTADDYLYVVRRYIEPYIGTVRLARFGPDDLIALQNALTDAGYSSGTVRYARAVLSRALRYAEGAGHIARNPVRLVDPPPRTGTSLDDTLTIEEARRLLAVAGDHRLGSLVTVALSIGLRKGEALGLHWEDVNLDDGWVAIWRTLKRRKGHGLVLVETKTKSSTARVAVPDACVAALRNHRRRQLEERMIAGSEWVDTGAVFTTPFGTYVDPRNANRIFDSLCEAAKLAPRRFHALRHSAATIMYEQGVPLEVISETLRHAGLSVTKDIYVHIREAVHRDAAAAMDRALGS